MVRIILSGILNSQICLLANPNEHLFAVEFIIISVELFRHSQFSRKRKKKLSVCVSLTKPTNDIRERFQFHHRQRVEWNWPKLRCWNTAAPTKEGKKHSRLTSYVSEHFPIFQDFPKRQMAIESTFPFDVWNFVPFLCDAMLT